MAISPDDTYRKQRLEIAEYLERFAYFFSAKFFLEKLFMFLTSSEGRPKEVQTLFEALTQRDQKVEPGVVNSTAEGEPSQLGRKDVREWIYDIDKESEYKFNLTRARSFF